MKQVIAIHGGDAFSTYEEYLDDLRNFKIESIEYFRGTTTESRIFNKH